MVDLRDEIEKLASEWEEASKWGNRDMQSDYERGIKDATHDHANRLRELIND